MYVPHQKQVSAHLAFLAKGYKRGVLLMGRQCLAPETLVKTDRGLRPISELEVGDLVLSYGNGAWEYKPVINTWQYDVDTDPKPMLHFKIGKEVFSTTHDHPFIYNGESVPIYQLAWRAMAPSQRQKLELLCQQYGQTLDYESPWLQQDSSNETGTRQKGISADGSGRQDNQVASLSRSDLASEPREQAGSKSHRRQPSQQPGRQFGVGDTSGEYSAHPQNGASGQQAGRELRDSYPGREAGPIYPGGQAAPFADSSRIWGFMVHNPGRTTSSELVSHITVSECEPTCAIDVETYHNFAITESEVLVANSGKTYFANAHGWLSAILGQGRYFIVFKTYKQAHEVIWRQYIPLIPKELVYKKNEQDLLIEFNYVNGPVKLPDGTLIQVEHDQTKPRSTLQLLGSDQADSHRGFKANGMIFDEYADQNPDNWDAVYKHFFTTTDGWAIFMGTPRGYNHFYDLIEYAKEEDRWFYQEATWRDSPYVSREFIEEERKEAEKTGKLSTFLQEVELEFRAVQGAVYPGFDRKIHIVKPSEVPSDLTIYAGIDFGYHTTACLFVGIDKDQHWYVFDEIYSREETLADVMPRIKTKIGDQRMVLMVGDSAAADAIETMAAKGFPVTPVIKRQDSIIHGIDLIRQKLRARIQLTGPPKPELYFSSVCKNAIQEFEAYKYPEDKPDRNPSELPQKENDHGPDALRYLMLHLKYGVQREKDLPKNSVMKEMNQYGLI